MSDQTSLRDYASLIRRYWLVILASTFVAIGLAFGISINQETVYASEASLILEDENQALGLLGTSVAPSSTPAQRATQGANLAVSAEVLERVRREIRPGSSLADLRRSIKATPDPETSLVVIEARHHDARFSAWLANAVARLSAAEQTTQARARFESAADRLGDRLRATPRGDPSRVLFAQQVSQLESLAAVARPARIAAEASVPDSPVSPRPVRNATLAGILGLMLGLAIAAVRNALDRRVRADDDLQDVWDLPILGHIPDDAMGQVGFGVESHRVDEGTLEPFRILRTNVESLVPHGQLRTIAVTSALPQEGKSTVAASLACAFALAGRRTLLVEGDLRRPVLAKRMGVGQVSGLSEYLSGEGELSGLVQSVSLAARTGLSESMGLEAPELRCIFAGSRPEYPAELLGSVRFAALLAEFSRDYDAIVIDTSPLLLVADTLQMLPHVDGVLLCARISQTTRDQTRAAQQTLGHLASKPTGLVMTGIKSTHDGAYGDYLYKYTYS